MSFLIKKEKNKIKNEENNKINIHEALEIENSIINEEKDKKRN